MFVPENEEQLLKRIQPIIDDAHKYLDAFEFGDSEAARDQQLEQSLSSWKDEFFTTAIVTSVDRLRQQVQRRYDDTPYLNRKIPQLGEIYIDALGTIAEKLVTKLGDERTMGLTGLLLAHYDDNKAIGAVLLADRAEKITDSVFRYFITGFIRQSYESTQGSASKIALAYAMHKFGDDTFMKSSGLEDSISDLRKETSVAAVALGDDEEAKKGANDLVEVLMRTGVIKIVSLDLASFGHAFTNHPDGSPWIRGTYAI